MKKLLTTFPTRVRMIDRYVTHFGNSLNETRLRDVPHTNMESPIFLASRDVLAEKYSSVRFRRGGFMWLFLGLFAYLVDLPASSYPYILFIQPVGSKGSYTQCP